VAPARLPADTAADAIIMAKQMFRRMLVSPKRTCGAAYRPKINKA
jgi:hypothetical protein